MRTYGSLLKYIMRTYGSLAVAVDDEIGAEEEVCQGQQERLRKRTGCLVVFQVICLHREKQP